MPRQLRALSLLAPNPGHSALACSCALLGALTGLLASGLTAQNSSLPQGPAGSPPPAGAHSGQQPGEQQPGKQGPSKAQQQPSSQKPNRGQGTVNKPVVVTATRSAQDPLQVPYTTGTITEEDFRRRSYRTVPQALRDTPGVMVQETAHGHGSPYIRGFTSFRNLFLVDGIRLNNSVFRSGPNQYWNTVDPWSLDRLEIVKGPSSVLYGSDAVGGTVQAFTRSPYATADATGWGRAGSLYLRYSTAEDSVQGRGEISVARDWSDGSYTSLLVGGTGRSFDDLEGGDSVGTQPYTGYDEADFDIKLEHGFDDNHRLVFLHQNVRQNDVPRTHRTVFGINWRGLSNGSDQLREFDQERRLTYLQYFGSDLDSPFADSIHASVSLHEQDELRVRVRGNGNQENQGFDVDSYGLFIHAEKQTAIGTLSYGFDYYRDQVGSFLDDLSDPNNAADMIQGPVADDASYDLLGVYLQQQLELGERVELTLGGRFNYAAADADSVRDPVTDTRINLSDDWSDFLGSARLKVDLVEDHWTLFGGASQGFRAPNLSDLTRFDSARSNEFEIPAPNLNAEEYIQYEVGTKVQTGTLSFEGSYFYTDIDDQILRFPTGNVNGGGDFEVTRSNIGDGHIEGVEAALAWEVAPDWTVFGNFTWLYGRIQNFNAAGSPARNDFPTRLMPITYQGGVRYEPAESGLWVEAVVVRAEDQDKLSFSDQRDTSRVVPGGTPSYTVFHARAGYAFSRTTDIQVLWENITDVDYRVHGSGQNAPGTNFIFGMRTTF